MGEVDPESLAASGIVLTSAPEQLAEASFIIIAVPTPITKANQPDLGAVEAAARTVGRHLQEGTVVVLESTVYPGVTEEVLGPILARASGLRAGTDFFLAYSPERANPGDPEHMAIGNDGGVYITWDGGGAWDFGEYFPIGQFYEVSYDFRVPYYICGGAQDNGSHCGPSRRKGNIQNSYWFMVTGGDGFYTQQHPREPWIVWSESQGGNVQRTNLRTGEAQPLAKPGYRQRYLMLEDSIMMVRGENRSVRAPPISIKIARGIPPSAITSPSTSASKNGSQITPRS